MKKYKFYFLSLFFIAFSFIYPKAAISDTNAFNDIFTQNVPSKDNITNLIEYVNNYSPNWWDTKYYLIWEPHSGLLGESLAGHIVDSSTLFMWTIDKTNAKITLFTSAGSDYNVVTYENWNFTNVNGFIKFNTSVYYGSSAVINSDYNYTNPQGDQGLIVYTNVPIVYQNGSNSFISVENRIIPWDYWPLGHPLRIQPTESTQIDNFDNKTTASVYFTSVLNKFNFDEFYLKLTSVIDLLFEKFTDTFNAVISVFDYITNSFTLINSFISSNAGIVSLISLSYLALPSILRNIFILGLSSSVIFIMLRRAM